MNFNDIPKLPRISTCFQLEWKYLRSVLLIEGYGERYNLELNPDFQRGHKWGIENQVEYIEFILRGGKSGKDVYFNIQDSELSMTCIDGLQRITAILAFLDGEIKAFNYYISEFTGTIPSHCELNINIARLGTRLEILQWYRDLNKSVPHTKDELEKVDRMIENEKRMLQVA